MKLFNPNDTTRQKIRILSRRRLRTPPSQMTIHSDYVKILKRERADAFTDALSPELRPDTVFIDGQVKLMKADDIKTWTVFLNVMFFKTIERCFKHGARVVVLGFDDYTYVPKSKTMTQAKRNKKVPDMKFSEKDKLPAIMPDDWGAAMRNRTFKVKVIQKILAETKTWFLEKIRMDHSWSSNTLILDFAGRPTVLFSEASTADREPAFARGCMRGVDFQACLPAADSAAWRGRGECDVKAFFWMAYSRRLLLVSTDGDFVPLAMLQMLRVNRKDENCDVFLFRLRTKSEDAEEPTAKRQCVTGGQTRKHKREYEFVHIDKLVNCVEKLMPSRVQTPVDQFCTLVALSGCDFALTLPRVGPRTAWKLRHRLAHLDLSKPVQILCAMTVLYWDTFVMKNTTPTGMTNSADFFQNVTEDEARAFYHNTIERIRKSAKVSPRISAMLWNTERAYAHALNITWTMAYWNKLHEYPDPHSQNYGYTKDKKGLTLFAFDS